MGYNGIEMGDKMINLLKIKHRDFHPLLDRGSRANLRMRQGRDFCWLVLT